MVTAPKNNIWPTDYEYDEALQKRSSTFQDPAIRNGELKEVTVGQPMHLNGGGTRHIVVYRVGDTVVRCFATDPPNKIYPPEDLIERYNVLIPYLQSSRNRMPFLVAHEWGKPGINVKGKIYPYLKIPYLKDSETLGDFLIEHYEQKPVVEMLGQKWLKIIQQLEANKVAHGDLDLSNVLVCGNYPALSLHLVDFDGMYVPDFAGKSLGLVDSGHPNFQPAQRGVRTFGPEMDRFSALIIYLSLCAIEMRPSLWEECEGSDRTLLLGEDDFQRLGQSTKFPLLRQEHGNGRLQLCLEELQNSIDKGQMPRSLHDILYTSPYVPRSESKPTPAPQPVTQQHYTGRSIVLPIYAQSDIDVPSSLPPVVSSTIPSLPTTTEPERDASPIHAQKGGRLTGFYLLLTLIIIAIIIWILFLYVNAHSTPSNSSSLISGIFQTATSPDWGKLMFGAHT